MKTDAQKIEFAMRELRAVKTDGGWVYYSEPDEGYHLCTDPREMAMLYEILHSEEADMAANAIGHWAGAIIPDKCDINGHLIV
jgi:hypothetical protein